jgi:dTDP-4-dehydrorhamnose 3,5-epimerase
MQLLSEISAPLPPHEVSLLGDPSRQLDVQSLEIPDVRLIRTRRFSDARGYFCDTFRRADFAAHGLVNDFIQDNQSSSTHRGTVRGLHFQRPPFAQTKLVRLICGRAVDVAVDLRRSSRTFGRHVGVQLSSDDNAQLLIPRGFAHGFCTLESDTVVFYKVDQVYSAAADGGIYWADDRLAIEWPVGSDDAILSEKDRGLSMLADLGSVFE